jgi:hypothetical protein
VNHTIHKLFRDPRLRIVTNLNPTVISQYGKSFTPRKRLSSLGPCEYFEMIKQLKDSGNTDEKERYERFRPVYKKFNPYIIYQFDCIVMMREDGEYEHLLSDSVEMKAFRENLFYGKGKSDSLRQTHIYAKTAKRLELEI